MTTSPLAIRGRRNFASVALMRHLQGIGVRASVGHGGRGNVLYAWTMNRNDVGRVPREFDGWDVIAKHFSENESSTIEHGDLDNGTC